MSLLLAEGALADRLIRDAARFPRLRFVAVTCEPRVAPFFRAGIVAEHLPSPAWARAAEVPGDWRAYLRRRWAMIVTKWEPSILRHDGVSLESYLEACSPAPSGPGS